MIKNHGVIEGKLITDYIAGANSPLTHEVVNPSGDWLPYLPSNERQSNTSFDTYACVSYSALNCLETTLNFRGEDMGLGFSDRFTAIMSNTVPGQGNYLWRVAESIRKDGVVPESAFSAPPNYTESTYYTGKDSIPQTVKDMGKAWLERYDVSYEWLPQPVTKEDLMHHLKHVPIQIVIPGHAIMEIQHEGDVYSYFDHYVPFVKSRTILPTSAMKIILTEKNMELTKSEVKKLQALEGYSDQQGVEYWGAGDKTLTQYLDARLPDKKLEIEKALSSE